MKQSIRSNTPDIQIRFWIAEASLPSFDEAALHAVTNDLHLTILINNVGGTHSLSNDFKTFESTTPTEIEALFNINVRFTFLTTRFLLPILTRSGPGNALILNSGSHACVGTPYMAAYSGTKAFLNAWSRGLKAELRAEVATRHVDVVTILIGTTQSNQIKTAAGWMVPTAREMAKGALVQASGRWVWSRVWGGWTTRSGWWMHAVQNWVVSGLLPEAWAGMLAVMVLKPVMEGKKTL